VLGDMQWEIGINVEEWESKKQVYAFWPARYSGLASLLF
jgi:hypothetical protein